MDHKWKFICMHDLEVETHVHVQIENQLGFHELQIACYNRG